MYSQHPEPPESIFPTRRHTTHTHTHTHTQARAQYNENGLGYGKWVMFILILLVENVPQYKSILKIK